MGFEILHDVDKDVYALIDPEGGRALGPVIHGEGGEQLLESFVGALGQDPATIPVWTLEVRWEQFLSAIHAGGPVDQAAAPPAEVARPAQTTAEANLAEGGTHTAPASAAPDQPAVEEHTLPKAEGQPPAAVDVAPAGEQARPGPVVCPGCDGFGTVAKDGQEVTCPTCGGQRVVPHDDPSLTGTPAA